MPVSAEEEKILRLNAKSKKPSVEKKDGNPSGAASQEGKDNELLVKENGSQKCLKMIGFANQDSVGRHQFMAGVDIILPMKGAKNERAFAAMVHAMIEKKKVLIAKLVQTVSSDPKLVTLHPHVSKKQPLLYLAQVPTAEDMRDYQFPPLVQSTNQ